MDSALNPFLTGELGYLSFNSTVGLGFQPRRIAVVDIVAGPVNENGLLYNSQREELESL